MSGSDDSKTYWTYRRYSDFHDIDIRLREVLGEADFPLELPKKEKFYRFLYPFPVQFGDLNYGRVGCSGLLKDLVSGPEK